MMTPPQLALCAALQTAMRAFHARDAARAKVYAATAELEIAERELALAVEGLEAVKMKEGV
jgi:hypothetical protein